MFLIMPVVTAGSLLPTWMFINSLQIIAHMVLLKTLMPGTAHYFLNKYLNWLRWYDSDIIEWLASQSIIEFKKYDLDFGAYHTLLEASDYEHLFVQNMVIIIAVLLIILLLWLIIASIELISRIIQTCKNKPNGNSVNS